MKVGEKILYYNGMCGKHDNKEYFDMLHHITAGGVCTGGGVGVETITSAPMKHLGLVCMRYGKMPNMVSHIALNGWLNMAGEPSGAAGAGRLFFVSGALAL